MTDVKTSLKEANKYIQEAYDFVSQYVFDAEVDDEDYLDAQLEATDDEYVDMVDAMHVLNEQLYNIKKLLKSAISKVRGDKISKGEMKKINKTYSLLNNAIKYAKSQYNKVDTPSGEYKNDLMKASDYMSKVKKSLENVINN